MQEFEAWQKILDEWKEVNRIKMLNQQLYDMLGGSILYIFEYAEKNSITLPNRGAIIEMVDRIGQLMDSADAPTTLQQPSETTKERNSADPNTKV